VILLDTNALIWLDGNHRRARPLLDHVASLRVSPASLLELQFLADVGRIDVVLADVIADARWTIDDPPALPWMVRAAEEHWTRDPFDRLIVAHARFRGWRLATGDDGILQRLRARERLEL
jgi:PIN domain nuclease of toxin-antitoxin system